MPRTIRKIGVPTAEGINDVWQRRAAAAAILAVRDVIRGGAIRAAARVERLTDIELGWLFTAALFGWIKTRAEQATAEGWDVEETLRLTSLNPQPWDAGAVRASCRNSANCQASIGRSRLVPGRKTPW